jgi:hypothetical protein
LFPCPPANSLAYLLWLLVSAPIASTRARLNPRKARSSCSASSPHPIRTSRNIPGFRYCVATVIVPSLLPPGDPEVLGIAGLFAQAGTVAVGQVPFPDRMQGPGRTVTRGTLPRHDRCASIGRLRRADQGFIRFSFAPRSGTQAGPRSPSYQQFARRWPAPVLSSGGPPPGDPVGHIWSGGLQ